MPGDFGSATLGVALGAPALGVLFAELGSLLAAGALTVFVTGAVTVVLATGGVAVLVLETGGVAVLVLAAEVDGGVLAAGGIETVWT